MPQSQPNRLSVKVELAGSLVDKFLAQAAALNLTPEQDAALLIDNGVAPQQLTDDAERYQAVEALAGLIRSLPGVNPWCGISEQDQAFWWIKFSLDRTHPLVWHVLQRLAFVCNYYRLEHRFFVKLYPVSPPPYLNGGPSFLAWVLEAQLRYVDPRPVLEALRAELPEDVANEDQWRQFDENGDQA